MAEIEPDFTFGADQVPDRELLTPLYRQILGPDPKVPTVSLGPVTRACAEAWLRRQHDRYREGIGSRSHLIKNMDLTRRVELVGLAHADS